MPVYPVNMNDLFGRGGTRKQLQAYCDCRMLGVPMHVKRIVQNIDRAIALVPDPLQQRVLICKYQIDMPIHKIAKVMGYKVEAVRHWLKLAYRAYEIALVEALAEELTGQTSVRMPHEPGEPYEGD